MSEINNIQRDDNTVITNATPKREGRNAAEREAQIIRKFLESVTPYEADALRISIAIAGGKTTQVTLTQADRLAVNRFLNYGADKVHASVAQLQEQRMKRAFQLVRRAADYCDKSQTIELGITLASIATNPADIENARKSLATTSTVPFASGSTPARQS